MTTNEGLSVELPTFTAKSSVTDGAVHILMTGQADIPVLAPLDKLLQDVHKQAVALASSEVVVDLKAVDFMNSSCLSKLIAWIGRVRDLEPSKRYKIRFRSRPEILWQRRGLHALRCFATDLIVLDS